MGGLSYVVLQLVRATEAQLRQREVPPSKMSLLGLVRHMAEVERNWFRPVLGGEEMSGLWAAGGGAGSRACVRRGGHR